MSPLSYAEEFKLIIYTESFAPYNFQNEDGQLVGINIDIVRDVCSEASLECEFILLPWKRSYQSVQNNARSAIISLAKTEERAPLFHWIGPLVSSQTYFYRLKNNDHIVMNDITEAKNYSLGIVRGDIYETLVARLGFVKGKNLLMFSEKEEFMRLFFKKRIDLIVGSDFTIGHQTRPFGFSRDDLVKLKQIHVNALEGNFIGFNKQVPPVIIKRFNETYAKLMKTKGFDPYIKRYVKN
jgi:polar amino acid transport system substrate-binding protein